MKHEKSRVRISLLHQLTLAFLCIIFANAAALAHPPSVYVNLFQARQSLDAVFLRAPFAIVNPIHRVFHEGCFEIVAEGRSMRISQIDPKRSLIIRAPHVVITSRSNAAVEIGPDLSHMRKYYGQLTVNLRPAQPRRAGGLNVVNLIDSFNYVSSVVGGETTPQFGKEALKAQAVLVYTRLSPKGKHPVLSDTTDEMVYLGAQHERPEVIDAVNEVDRRRLMFHDYPAQAFFHACCAGRTSRGVDIFGENARALTYLQSIGCNFCKRSPLYRTTTKQIPASIFNREIADSQPLVLQTDEAKRIIRAELRKKGAKKVLSGYQLWLEIGQKLGWDKAPGTRYEIKQSGAHYTLKSSGGGHGVGMCQWGAQGMAAEGKTFSEILQYYFPGTTVEKR